MCLHADICTCLFTWLHMTMHGSRYAVHELMHMSIHMSMYMSIHMSIHVVTHRCARLEIWTEKMLCMILYTSARVSYLDVVSNIDVSPGLWFSLLLMAATSGLQHCCKKQHVAAMKSNENHNPGEMSRFETRWTCLYTWLHMPAHDSRCGPRRCCA